MDARTRFWLDWVFAKIPPLRWWFTIKTQDEDAERRAVSLQFVNLFGLLFTPIFGLASLGTSDTNLQTLSLGSTIASMLTYAFASWLGRRGKPDFGGVLICVQILVNLLTMTWWQQEVQVHILIGLLTPIIALLCLRPAHVLIICGLTFTAILTSGALVPSPVSEAELRRIVLGLALVASATPLIMLNAMTVRHFMHQMIINRVSLEKERQRAESASLAKSTFLANVSHELRTPLNAIIGYSELLVEDIESLNMPTQAEDLSNIHLAGRQILALVDDVLDLAKIEEGKYVVISAPIDLQELLDELRATINPAMLKQGNELTIIAPTNVGTIITDGQKLRQILLNLLSNAAKFTHRGTVNMTVNATNDTITFTIEDTGLGLSKEDIQRIFTPFAQANLHNNIQRGTGLGLSLSLEMARLLHGDITAASTPGKGSRFTVHIARTLPPLT